MGAIEYAVDSATGCWNWLRGKTAQGYAVAYLDSVPFYVHRFMYHWYVGPIPERFDIDHQCSNTSCINPSHLKAVTHADNIRRGKSNLTAQDVRHIRSRYAEGSILQKQLAAEFGVTPDSISDIITNRRWGNI